MPEQALVPANRAGERTYVHDLTVDVRDLRDRANVSRSDQYPGALDDPRRVAGLIQKRPRQAAVVLTVQIGRTPASD